MQESNLIKQILLSLPANRRLFRINAGTAWTGRRVDHIARGGCVDVLPGDVVIRGARPFHGAIQGWPDLVGWESVEITPDMVGQRFARFVALEVKTKGVRVTDAQGNFIEQVRSAGGAAEVVRE